LRVNLLRKKPGKGDEVDTREIVRKFIRRLLRNREVADEDNIFEKHYVNSLFAMQLVLFIEEEFSVEISNEDLDPDKFRSINAICSLIDSYMQREDM